MYQSAAVAVAPTEPAIARRTLGRVCAATLIAYSSYSICRTPLLPMFARELGASAPGIGIIMAASTLTGVFVKLPAGALSDLLGRHRLLVAGALVFAVMPFTYLAVAAVPLLIFLRVIHGSATAIFGPVASASLSDVAPPGRRGAWLSMYSTAQGTGQALGPVVAGYLIASGRFDLAFLTAGIIGLGVPLVLASGSVTPSSGPSRVSWDGLKAGVREVAGDRLVLITSAAQAAQFVLNGTLNAFLPLYAREQLGLTPSEVGWLFGVQTLTTLAVRPAIGIWSDRSGRRSVIVTGLTVCSLAVFSVSLADSAPALVAAIVIYAAGVATTTAATSAFITDITRQARYGAAHGVFGTIYDIGDALGPIVAGFLVVAAGYAQMFQIVAAAAFAMAIAFGLVSRNPEIIVRSTK